jgi:hypothetical protein
MNDGLVAAVFDSQVQAERAVSPIRGAGISDAAISIIAQSCRNNAAMDGGGEAAAAAEIGKASLGSGAGTLIGIAASAIRGVGPLVATGAIAAAAIPGAAVGAADGGLTDLLTDHGVDREDADYYEKRVNAGGVFVSVDTTGTHITSTAIQQMLYAAGGHTRSRSTANSVL